MQRTFKFYKTLQDRWYIDIPEWTGPKEDLEMVLGADIMLNLMAGNNDLISIYISDTYFDNSSELQLMSINPEDIGSGANYIFRNFQGITLNYMVWLCDVVLYIFGTFPKSIYICLQD